MRNRKLLTLVSSTALMVVAANAGASDFIHKKIECPVNNANLVGTPDGNINIEDVIISASAATDVTVRFTGGEQGNRTFIRVYMAGNDTFVSNFAGTVDGERNASMKVGCTGNATIDVTLVGSGDLE